MCEKWKEVSPIKKSSLGKGNIADEGTKARKVSQEQDNTTGTQ